jgi:hypothetical protein
MPEVRQDFAAGFVHRGQQWSESALQRLQNMLISTMILDSFARGSAQTWQSDHILLKGYSQMSNRNIGLFMQVDLSVLRFLLFCCVLFLAIGPGESRGQNSRVSTFEAGAGYIYDGSDVIAFDNETSPEACQKKCVANLNCRAWAYTSERMPEQAIRNKCFQYKKKSSKRFQKDPSFISSGRIID